MINSLHSLLNYLMTTPFHDYDPYGHLCGLTEQVQEVIRQHNAMSQHVHDLTLQVQKLSAENTVFKRRLATLIAERAIKS